MQLKGLCIELESFPLSVNSKTPTDHHAKSRSALMARQTLGRSLVTGSKQSANPPVSPRSKQTKCNKRSLRKLQMVVQTATNGFRA
jgi:hypothetical protein